MSDLIHDLDTGDDSELLDTAGTSDSDSACSEASSIPPRTYESIR